MDEDRIYKEIDTINSRMDKFEEQVNSIDKRQIRNEALFEQVIKLAEKTDKTNEALASTMSDVKITMVTMQNSLQNLTKEVFENKVEMSKVKEAIENEKDKSTIDIKEIQKEEVKKKLSPMAGVGIGGGIVALLTIIFQVLDKIIK